VVLLIVAGHRLTVFFAKTTAFFIETKSEFESLIYLVIF